MKKLIPVFFAGALLATACEKLPDTDKLDNNYLVYTNYDSSTDFKKFTTFYVPDSVLIIDNSSNKPKYLYGTPASDIIIANYIKGLEDAGYEYTPIKEDADLGLQISYVEDTYKFRYFNDYPWWYGYPWYWSFNYWGNWGDGTGPTTLPILTLQDLYWVNLLILVNRQAPRRPYVWYGPVTLQDCSMVTDHSTQLTCNSLLNRLLLNRPT